MEISTYKPTDKAAVLNLITLNTPSFFAIHERDELDEYLMKYIELYYIVRHQGEIVGAAGINFENNGQHATMSWDIIHPDFQGKGIGSLLVKHRFAILAGYPKVRKILSRTSQLTYPFYEKHGFTTVDTKKDHWAPGLDLYAMERDA